MDNSIYVKNGIIAIVTLIFSKLGNIPMPIMLLVMANIVDYMTGIIASNKRGNEIKSKIGIEGIKKKIMQWVLVFAGFCMDLLISYGTNMINSFEIVNIEKDFTGLAAILVAIWLFINELISILENVTAMGVSVPDFLLKLINTSKEQIEKKGDELVGK